MNRRRFFGVIAAIAAGVTGSSAQAAATDRLRPVFYSWGIVFDVTKPGDRFREFKAVRFPWAKRIASIPRDRSVQAARRHQSQA